MARPSRTSSPVARISMLAVGLGAVKERAIALRRVLYTRTERFLPEFRERRPDCKMEYLIGLFLSLAVAGLVVVVGLDREPAFYPTVLIVIAAYYVLFAVMGASIRILLVEIAITSGFLLIAIIGYKRNLWLVAIALGGHGVFDIVHRFLF